MQTQVAIEPTPVNSVVIADRSDHFRETLRRVVDSNPGASVAGEASTLADALRLVRSTGAGVILLDVDLVLNQPAARLRRIASAFPGLDVIVLLNEDLPGYRRAVTERWGYECVAKEHAESDLSRTLRALRGKRRQPAT